MDGKIRRGVWCKPRKQKLIEAKERFELRNNGEKRFTEVKPDYSNIVPWPFVHCSLVCRHIAIATSRFIHWLL